MLAVHNSFKEAINFGVDTAYTSLMRPASLYCDHKMNAEQLSGVIIKQSVRRCLNGQACSYILVSLVQLYSFLVGGKDA